MVHELRTALVQAPDAVIGSLSHRMTALAAEERFEDAGSFRDRLAAFLRGAARPAPAR